MNHIRRIILVGGLVLAAALALSACFSPYKGEGGVGYIVIGNDGGAAKTLAPGVTNSSFWNDTNGELDGKSADWNAPMTFKVSLSGPGGSFVKELTYPGGTIELLPGVWHINVRAYNHENSSGVFGSGARSRLRGIAETDVTVSSGDSHAIPLKAVVGIANESELAGYLGGGGNWLYSAYFLSGTDNTLVLENDIDWTVTGLITTPAASNTFIVMAEPGTTRAIKRGAPGSVFDITVGSTDQVTLGDPNGSGTLVIDGQGITDTSAFLKLNGGILNIDGGTEITRCVNENSATANGGAVYVNTTGGAAGILNVKWAKINNNTAGSASTGTAYGGAIYCTNATGATVVFGPGPVEISGNTVYASTTAYGGAIYSRGALVLGGNLTISDNTAENLSGVSTDDARGGGIRAEGSFSITPNSVINILRNKVLGPNGATVSGGGLSYWATTSLTLAGATININDNTAETSGGASAGGIDCGVGITIGSTTSTQPVTISGNKSIGGNSTAGGGVYCNGSATITIAGNITISDNEARLVSNLSSGIAEGGGIWTNYLIVFTGSSSSILFSGNKAYASIGGSAKGGGLFIVPSGASVNFSYTAAGGGALFTKNSAITEDSSGFAFGGGIYVDTTSAVSPTYSNANFYVINNTAYSPNSAPGSSDGGGIYNMSSPAGLVYTFSTPGGNSPNDKN
jgi:hypothetical protein